MYTVLIFVFQSECISLTTLLIHSVPCSWIRVFFFFYLIFISTIYIYRTKQMAFLHQYPESIYNVLIIINNKKNQIGGYTTRTPWQISCGVSGCTKTFSVFFYLHSPGEKKNAVRFSFILFSFFLFVSFCFRRSKVSANLSGEIPRSCKYKNRV